MKTRDEITAILRDAANPDKAAEALTTLSSEINEMFDTIDSSKGAIDQMTGQIAGLRDANMRLFLRVTGSGEPENKEEPEKDKFAEFQANILSNLSGGNDNG